MPTGIISLKLGACLNMPTKRADKLLIDVARHCNRARNRMIRLFVRFHEDHPAYEPQEYVTTKGKTVKESASLPLSLVSSKCSTGFYRTAQGLTKLISAKIISSLQREIVTFLKSNVPYNHEGEASWRWQAILGYELNPPSFRSLCIPIPKQDVGLGYDGAAIGNGVTADNAKSTCIIRLPLLSRESGYQCRAPLFRLEVGKLSVGNRRLLKEIVEGKRDFGDSKLTRKDGDWFVRLVYDVPSVDHGLDPAKVATLFPSGKLSDRPMLMTFDDGRRWGMGDGKPLVAELTRQEIRRKAINFRYRKDGFGKGHGRKRAYRDWKPTTRAAEGFRREFLRRLVHDEVIACVKNGCGTLLYREPTMPLREHSWFAQHGIPFEWSEGGFLGSLKHACEKHKIVLNVERIGVKEHKTMFLRDWPANKEPDDAESPQAAAGVAVQDVRRNGKAHQRKVSVASAR